MRIGDFVKVHRIVGKNISRPMSVSVEKKYSHIRSPIPRPTKSILGSVGQIIMIYKEDEAYLVKFLFAFPNFTIVEGNYLIFDSEVVRPQDWEIREYKKWERTALARKVAKKL